MVFKHLLLATLFLSLLPLALSLEQENETPSEDDAQTEKGKTQRVLNVNIGDNNAEVKSEVDYKDFKEKWQWKGDFASSNNLRVEIKLDQEDKTTNATIKTDADFRFFVMGLIEFPSSQSPYQNGGATASTLPFKDNWGKWTAETVLNGIHSTSVTNTANNGCTTKLTFYYSDRAFEYPTGTMNSARSMKIDVEINNYTYSNSSSYLALQVDLEHTDKDVIGEAETSEDEFVTFKKASAPESTQSFFIWDKTLTIPSGASVIASNVLDSNTVKRVYYTFATTNPARIVWDPIAGASNSLTSGASAIATSLFSLLLFSAILLFF